MSATIIRNGRVIDPANKRDEVIDLLIIDGEIAPLSQLSILNSQLDEINASNLIVCPGLIDMHVHLREPGFGHKETSEAGARAAAAVGFTMIVCMPNTSPAADNPSTIAWIKDRAGDTACVNVLPAGAISKDLAGEELAPIGSLVQAGIVAITDDGHCSQNDKLMRRALEHAPMPDRRARNPRPDYSCVEQARVHQRTNGTLSVLASDHAPHADFEQEVAFDAAPFGIIGLETALGLFLDLLVHKHRKIDIVRLIKMCTVEPAKLLKLEAGTLSVGASADVTLLNPDLEWTVQIDKFESGSRNSPFDGWKLKGRAVRTIVGGKTIWELD